MKKQSKKLIFRFIISLNFILCIIIVTSPSTLAMQYDLDVQVISSAYDLGLISDESVVSEEITRLDAICLIAKAFSGEDYGPVEVYNVKNSVYLEAYISSAKELGILSEDFDEYLDEKISREECLCLIAICVGLRSDNYDSLRKVVDCDEISNYAKPYLAALVERGVIRLEDGYVNPKVNITLTSLLEVIESVFYLRVYS